MYVSKIQQMLMQLIKQKDVIKIDSIGVKHKPEMERINQYKQQKQK